MYMFRIHSTTGHCKEVRVKSYEFAIKRINHYRNNWQYFKAATLAYFDGVSWCEIECFN